MPELPEVETIKRYLNPLIINHKFKKIVITNNNLRYKIHNNFINNLINKKIIAIKRRAKYLRLCLDDNTELLFNFGMTGILLLNKSNTTKHDHVEFELDGGYQMTFRDTRRFGFILHDNCNYFNKMGFDPILDNFYLYNVMKRSKSIINIKTFLMNNKHIVGIGNIYASEILFNAKISPLRKSNSLSFIEYNRLSNSIESILRKAIKYGGSSIKDYKNPSGNVGLFQTKFLVYGQDNCKICGNAINTLKISGRNTFYCNFCQ